VSVIRRDRGVRRKRPVLSDPQTSQIVGELTDDLETINSRIEPLLKREIRNQTYTEPMQLALPYRPDGILLVRLMRSRAPDISPVLSGGMVEWMWRVQSTGGFAEIRSIDGLTPSAIRWDFTFYIFGRRTAESV
jgi:hypothetical protein